MRAAIRKVEPHSFCAVCGKPFSETEKVLAEHSNNFQCHHCWSPVRRINAHADSNYHTARTHGRVIPMAGKHRR